MKKEILSRGNFFKKSAIFAAGVSAAGLGIGLLNGNDAVAKSSESTPWPWPYVALDPEKARILGHDNYWNGFACSAGCFDAIITQLAEKLPDPYAGFPTKIMLFGHGGVAGWGTICGALNGAAAAISLVLERAEADPLIHELNGWYTQALFPSDIANGYGMDHVYNHTVQDMDLTQTVCGSILCHVSVTKWCTEANISVADYQRKERCGRLAGDVAAKTIEILNAYFAGSFASEYTPPAAIAVCNSCHGSSGMSSDTAALMDCTSCHGDIESVHIASGIASEESPIAFDINQNYPNPLSNETTIDFSLFVAAKVRLEVYNLNGQYVKTLIDNKNFSMGSHSVKWNGTDSSGQKASPGMYIYRLSVGSRVLSKTMMKL